MTTTNHGFCSQVHDESIVDGGWHREAQKKTYCCWRISKHPEVRTVAISGQIGRFLGGKGCWDVTNLICGGG
ncbi:hypothetical protein ACFX15_031495 [Malus domestica]